MFVNGWGQNVQSLERTVHRCFLPSFGSFGQTVSEEKNLKNQPIRNKSRLWRSCLLTDWDEMSKIYRGPSIDASYQVSVHLAKRFQRKRFLKIDQSETRIACSFGWGVSEEKIKMWKVSTGWYFEQWTAMTDILISNRK